MVHPALLSLALGTLGVIAALPDGPRLAVPRFPELGKPFNVTCNISRDVPEAAFTITADNRSFPVTVSRDGRQATAAVTVNRTGSAPLACAVRAGGAEERTSRTVHIYHVPEPLLDVSSATPAAGTVLRGRCALPPAATADIQVRVLARGRVLQGWGRAPLSFGLAVREEEEELELSCEAELLHLVQRSSMRIPVLSKPRLDSGGCPQQQNWTEGQDGILECRARGKPEPEVRCSKDGNSLAAGIPYPADRTHAGTYRCLATNTQGTAERNVTLWVQYDGSLPLLPVLLGVLLPVLALLGLAGFYLLYHHNTKIGEYWLWKRQPPVEARPLRPLGSSQAAAAPNGSAPKAP